MASKEAETRLQKNVTCYKTIYNKVVKVEK